MEPTSTAAVVQPNSTAAGWSTLSREDLASSTPMMRISADTARPDRYSYRAWPKGWSSSAGRSASRKPSMVTILLVASDRLFIASAAMDTDRVSSPTASFPPKSRILQKIPTMPERMPMA